MKSSKLLSASVMALAALATSSTFADGLTREQVRAEYFAAKAAGTLPVCSECDVHQPQNGVVKSAKNQPQNGVVKSAKTQARAQDGVAQARNDSNYRNFRWDPELN